MADNAAVILKNYFGAKVGEGLKEFVVELKKLTDEDKAQLVQGISDPSLTY